MRYFSAFVFICIIAALGLTSCLQLIAEVPPASISGPSSALISGSIDPEGKTGNFDEIYVLDRAPDEFYSGPYSIRLEDKDGKELGSYSFDILPTEGTLFFLLEIPWDDSVFRIVLLKDGLILTERSASRNRPEVNVLSPNGGETISEEKELVRWNASDADGNELTYVVQFSNDGGKSWSTAGLNLKETSINLDTSFLKNTQQGMIRVLASDGFYTMQDVSDDVFTVKTQAGASLYVDIYEDGGEFVGDQTVILEGEAYSNTGSLPEDQVDYTWSSNVDGVLGQGSSLFINASELSEGKHLITLTAEYAGFQSGSDSVEITIRSQFSSLSVATNELSFQAEPGDPGVMYQAVEIWHLGNHPITWSATADQEWIVLRAIGSETPSNLVVSADLSNLAVGVYTGNITIESNAEGNSMHTIRVTLEIKE